MLSTNLRMCMYINFNRYSEVEREAIQLFVISWYSHQSQSIFQNPYRKKMGDEICFDIEISVKYFVCVYISYIIKIEWNDISYHIKYFFIGALYVRMNLILILEFKCQNICSISNIIAWTIHVQKREAENRKFYDLTKWKWK